MSLGASPLTAYFSPASSSVKRKEYPPAPARKSKAPRNDDPVPESGRPQKGNVTKKQQDLTQHKFASLPKASTDPSTPNVGNRREYTTLQTPPASVDISGRARSKPLTRPVRSSFPHQSDVTAESISYLPSPSTRPRPKTRATAGSQPLSAETPCKPAALDVSNSERPSLLLRKTSPAALPTNLPNVVPSSQSQPELMQTLTEKNPPWSVTDDLEETEEESSDLTELAEYPHTNGYGLGVVSSQSQLLVPFQVSPRKKRRDGNSLVISTQRTEIDDVIPSSQSYEKELQIPSFIEDPLSIHNAAPPQARPFAWANKNNAPTRTLSDEIFSVPISSSSILDKLFDEEGYCDEHLAIDPPAAPLTAQGKDENQDSATETDTDDDCPHAQLPPASIQHLDQHLGNQESDNEVTNDCQVQAPASQLSRASDAEYAADCSQDADESPSSSLPSVLQDFRDMFADGNESYPADFPMSLRF